jgi:hypothetical protein
VVIAGATADIPIDLAVVPPERALRDVVHILLLGHAGKK